MSLMASAGLVISNERTHGAKCLFCVAFPGLYCVETGISTDGLNLLRSQDGPLPSCGAEPFSNSCS
ncbi:hypothetical protein AGR7B_pAt0327 [Agrobacterium deltaense RV3]|nr:hypothetical protein AGR7B_pAt0327 [Agrobacterium deltaense RV3]